MQKTAIGPRGSQTGPSRAAPAQRATRPGGASECRARAFVPCVPSLSKPSRGAEGTSVLGDRAQIADGVRGPRADASESTRRAECAAPCLSPHVTHSPPGSLSAWRRRAMQPGGVSANDTRGAEAPAWRRRAMQPGGVSANDIGSVHLVLPVEDRSTPGIDGEAGERGEPEEPGERTPAQGEKEDEVGRVIEREAKAELVVAAVLVEEP